MAGIRWPKQWVRAATPARHSHPSCDASVGLEATVNGSQYQSAVAGGYQTFDIKVWTARPTGQVHAGTPVP